MEIINDRTMLIGLGRAIASTTEHGKRAFGWVRLARVRSRQEGKTNTYVIAIRESDTQGFQLGCSCPHWVHRQRFANDGRGALCKHHQLFLSNQGKNAPKAGVWIYKAGKAFLAQFQKSTVTA